MANLDKPRILRREDLLAVEIFKVALAAIRLQLFSVDREMIPASTLVVCVIISFV